MRLFGIIVQDNPVCESLLYLTTEDGDFVLPLQMKGTNVMANTCTPTAQELHDCTHIVLLSEHPWDPHRVRFPESSRTVQEEIEMRRSIGGVRVSRVGLSREEPTNEKLSEAEIFSKDGVFSRLISSICHVHGHHWPQTESHSGNLDYRLCFQWRYHRPHCWHRYQHRQYSRPRHCDYHCYRFHGFWRVPR